MTAALLPLLHLCDSAFPIGAFAYSDGLESATAGGTIADADALRAWIDVCLDEGFGRMEGPGVWQAWDAVRHERWGDIAALDAELTALRPAAGSRRSSRVMGGRLLITWRALHPAPELDRMIALPGAGQGGPSLPVAFAAACACAGVERRASVEAFAYTRLSSTISASMRLMPIGQSAAHALLARALDRVPAIVDAIAERDAAVESFAPAMDLAQMQQQYVRSRLFRS